MEKVAKPPKCKKVNDFFVPGSRPTPTTFSLTGGGGVSADHVEFADIELIDKSKDYLRRVFADYDGHVDCASNRVMSAEHVVPVDGAKNRLYGRVPCARNHVLGGDPQQQQRRTD